MKCVKKILLGLLLVIAICVIITVQEENCGYISKHKAGERLVRNNRAVPLPYVRCFRFSHDCGTSSAPSECGLPDPEDC